MNMKLEKIKQIVENDKELETYWKIQNVNAIRRLGYTDHGPTHVSIVAENALKIAKLLKQKEIEFDIEKDYKELGLSYEDSEVVIYLASIMHDLGMVIHRRNHHIFSLFLAYRFLEKILNKSGIYTQEQKACITSEVLDAIYCHEKEIPCLTLEGSIVKVADALDMEKGRARIPFKLGKIDIHSVSALSIEEVRIEEGEEKPINIRIKMSNSAGIFQVTELLKNKIKGNKIEKYISVSVEVVGEKEKKIIEHFELKI